jgi:hypothetical protein
MARKAELIRMLEEAVDLEEKSMPILQQKCADCLAAVKNTEVVEEDRKKMRRILLELAAESGVHRLLIEAVIAKVKGSGRDEF